MLIALLFAGCLRSDEQQGGNANQSSPLVEEVQRGPVKLTVRADKSRVTVAEPFYLILEVEAEEDVAIELPMIGDALGEFQVRDTRSRPSIPVQGGRQWRQECVLESLKTGQIELSPLAVKFTDKRDPDNVIEGEIATPELTVEVVSLIEGEFDPTVYSDIKGVVELPWRMSWAWVWWAVGIVGGLILLMVLASWLRRRSARVEAERPIPAHEWAREQLRRLREERLVEQGEIQAFYFRLTNIVRQYIERRFGIMAAEQTTEEFLTAARDHPALGGTYRGLLAGFLRAGDMVKFARFEPSLAEIDQAFEAAADFVERTAASADAEPVEAAA